MEGSAAQVSRLSVRVPEYGSSGLSLHFLTVFGNRDILPIEFTPEEDFYAQQTHA